MGQSPATRGTGASRGNLGMRRDAITVAPYAHVGRSHVSRPALLALPRLP